MEKPLFFGSRSGKLDRCWLHDEEAPDYWEQGVGAAKLVGEAVSSVPETISKSGTRLGVHGNLRISASEEGDPHQFGS